MKTQHIVPCGYLYAQNRKFFLVKPEPVVYNSSWENNNPSELNRFLVVPSTPTEKTFNHDEKRGEKTIVCYDTVYGCPRDIVIHGDFVIEYDASIKELECLCSDDQLDKLSEEELNPSVEDNND